MKHPERLEDYLIHIAEAITRATSYVQPFENFEAFQKDLQAQDAVVRNIEIIGEAANHINRADANFMTQHPQIPWADMRDMRNVIAHQYFSVDLAVVWATVKNDLPALKHQIDHLLDEQMRRPPETDR